MHVVTVATHSEGFFPWFVRSCKRHGIRCTVLGWGQKWRGFNWRFELLHNHLKTLDAKELVCICDAYDVIFMQGASCIEATYARLSRKSHKPIVVAHDNGQYPPLVGMYLRMYYGTCLKQRINAGTWIGRAGDILRILSELRVEFLGDEGGDDQMLLTQFCQRRTKMFCIDTKNEMFLVAVHFMRPISRMPGLRVKEGELWYKGTRPCILHAAGGGDLRPILRAQGYRINSKEDAELSAYLRNYRIQKVKQQSLAVLPALLAVTALVVLI